MAEAPSFASVEQLNIRVFPSANHVAWNSIDDFGMPHATSLEQESSADDAATEALREAPARTVLVDDGVQLPACRDRGRRTRLLPQQPPAHNRIRAGTP
jgi:hypothetical protein